MSFLTHVVAGSPVTYVVIFVAVVLDGLVPLVPSEATIITASVLAAHGHLSVLLIVLIAALGAGVGDNASYGLGRGAGGPAAQRLFRGSKGQRRLDWARRAIHDRPWIVTLGRFLPGGRTAATFAAGMLGMRWRRFLPLDAAGGALWAIYAASLGYFGGDAFRHSLWKPLAISLAVGVLVATAIEVARRGLARRTSRSNRPRTGVAT